MAVWEWLVDSAGLLLLLVLLYGAALILRRRWLAREGGTFELSIRTGALLAGRGWVLGLGRYDADALDWYRIFSLWPRPKRHYRRQELEVLSQRSPSGPESLALYAGHVVVLCRIPGGEVEVAMSPASLTGFQAWLEAAPPSDPAAPR